MPPPVIHRVTKSEDAELPVLPTGLGELARKQAEIIRDSPFLSQFTQQIHDIDRLETCRQRLDPRHRHSLFKDLISARARQTSAEQMADNMLSSMAEILDQPSGDADPEDPERQKLMKAFHDRAGTKDNALKTIEEMMVMFNRLQKAAIEIASKELPRIQSQIAELAKERIELEFEVKDAVPPEAPQPRPEAHQEQEGDLPDVPQDPNGVGERIEQMEKEAWDKTQGDKNVIKVDLEEDEPEDAEMKGLIESLPKGQADGDKVP